MARRLTVSQCQECGGGTRRQASTLGEAEGAVEGQQPSSRAALCSVVQGALLEVQSARARQKDLKQPVGICHLTAEVADSPLADMTESGDAVESILLPGTSSSMSSLGRVSDVLGKHILAGSVEMLVRWALGSFWRMTVSSTILWS